MKFLDDFIEPEEYVFGFGKHRGMTYLDVREIDPWYIQWCAESIEWFKLTPDEKEYVDELVDEQSGPTDELDFN